MIHIRHQVLLFLTLIFWLPLCGQQIPAGISYQAVARDNRGVELANQLITVRLSLIRSAPSGDADWIESHAVNTDAYGLFNLVIGEGSHEGGAVGSFAEIGWGTAPYFLKVEVDFGTGFRSMGVSPFLSVPYALYAIHAGNNQGGGDTDSTNELISSVFLNGNSLVVEEGNHTHSVDLSRFYAPSMDDQQLSFNPVTHLLSLENGGSVDLSDIVSGTDKDSTNELISNLSLQGNLLEIHEGNNMKSVDLSRFMDNTDNQDLVFDPVNQHLSIQRGSTLIDLKEIIESYDGSSTNEIQHLTKVGSVISLDKNGGTIIDADSDSTNELQTLGLNGNVLSLSKGNSVTFNFNDADADPANEIQDLNFSGNLLSLSKDPTSDPVDLSKYLDNTDDQILTIDKQKGLLMISRLTGNQSVNIDADTTNEIQDLKLVGNILKITKNAGATSIDLSGYLDNTDAQTLANVNGNLTISGGNTVNIRESMVAFRVLKNGINLINHPDSTILYFDLESLDTKDSYDPASGTFTVPAGGAGIFSFTVCYAYASTQILRIIKNGIVLETLQPFDNYSFLLNLVEGDKIAIRLVNPSNSNTFNNSIGSFSGYRINQ